MHVNMKGRGVRAATAALLAVVGASFVGIGPATFLADLHVPYSSRSARFLSATSESKAGTLDEARVAFDRPLHVLSLGGSVTWGAVVVDRTGGGEDRSAAYPFLLASSLLPPNSTVTNIAVRATGADLAAMCLQSMVLEGHAEQNPSVVDAHGGHDIDYDIITVEYSINGIANLDLLLQRLRRRYPRAIIVYVHLYAWKDSVLEEKSQKSVVDMQNEIVQKAAGDFRVAMEWGSNLRSDSSYQWSWVRDAGLVRYFAHILDNLRRETQNIGGIVYELPGLNRASASHSLAWFADDLLHLNEAGHKHVAREVASIIDSHRDALVPSNHDENYGWGDSNGDQCISWYGTGTSNKVKINKDIIPFAPSKFAIEVSYNSPATIAVDNPFGVRMPLGLSAMAHKTVYPRARVTVTSTEGGADIALEKKNEDNLTPGVMLDPFNRNRAFRNNHVVQSHFIGYAEPGRNLISIKPIETTEEPLRVTGVIMCKDCGIEGMAPQEN